MKTRKVAPGIFKVEGSRFLQLRYRGPKDGTHLRGEYRESAQTANLAAAKRKLRVKVHAWEKHLDEGARIISPESRRKSVAELVANLLGHRKIVGSKSTRQDTVHAAHLVELLGSVKAKDVTPTTLDAYITARRAQGDVANATIDRELELLRPAFVYGGLETIAPSVTKLTKLHSNARQGFFERSEFEAVVGQLPSEVLQDIAWFGYLSGWRKSEILSLTWDSWDDAEEKITLQHQNSKTGEGRSLPVGLLPELKAVMQRRIAARILGRSLVFHNGTGSRVGDFYGSFRRACERAGVKDKCFHDLRRTAARNMVRAGVAQTVCMAITGHKTTSMFQRYNITDSRDLADAMAKRAAYEEGKKATGAEVVPIERRSK